MAALAFPTGYGLVMWKFIGPATPTGGMVTCGFKNNAAVSATAASATLRSAFVTNVLPRLITGATLGDCTVNLGPSTGPLVGTTTGSNNGSQNVAGQSPAVSIVVTKVTALAGKKGRGHMFIPSMPATDVGGNGLLAATPLASWQTALTALFNAMHTANLDAYLFHSVGSSLAGTPTAITAFTVQSRSGTNRQRNRR